MTRMFPLGGWARQESRPSLSHGASTTTDVDNSTYQQRLQARMAEWAALSREGPPGNGRTARERRAAATARSTQRWQTDTDRTDQEHRAGRLELVTTEPPAPASGDLPELADGT